MGQAVVDGERCELISIDGGYSYHAAFVDLVNARWLAAAGRHDCLIDDTNANTSISMEVTGALEDYGRMHNITVLDRWRWEPHRAHGLGKLYKRGLTRFRWNSGCVRCGRPWRNETYAAT